MKKNMFQLTLKGNFDNIVTKVKEELAQEKFGILTEVNVKDKFKEKLGIDFENYLILGACNPKFAHKVLQIEKEIGIFLPCKVIIYQKGDLINISIQRPTVISDLFQNLQINAISKEIERKLKNVYDNLKKMEE